MNSCMNCWITVCCQNVGAQEPLSCSTSPQSPGTLSCWSEERTWEWVQFVGTFWSVENLSTPRGSTWSFVPEYNTDYHRLTQIISDYKMCCRSVIFIPVCLLSVEFLFPGCEEGRCSWGFVDDLRSGNLTRAPDLNNPPSVWCLCSLLKPIIGVKPSVLKRERERERASTSLPWNYIWIHIGTISSPVLFFSAVLLNSSFPGTFFFFSFLIRIPVMISRAYRSAVLTAAVMRLTLIQNGSSIIRGAASQMNAVTLQV